MSIGKNIREARKRMGISAEQLAKRVQCSQSSISQYERDMRDPSPKILYRIAHVLGCSVAQLVTADYIRSSYMGDDAFPDILMPFESNETISQDEYIRFNLTFEKLNSEGRRRVFEFMEDLAEISRYRIDFGENQ